MYVSGSLRLHSTVKCYAQFEQVQHEPEVLCIWVISAFHVLPTVGLLENCSLHAPPTAWSPASPVYSSNTMPSLRMNATSRRFMPSGAIATNPAEASCTASHHICITSPCFAFLMDCAQSDWLYSPANTPACTRVHLLKDSLLIALNLGMRSSWRRCGILKKTHTIADVAFELRLQDYFGRGAACSTTRYCYSCCTASSCTCCSYANSVKESFTPAFWSTSLQQ